MRLLVNLVFIFTLSILSCAKETPNDNTISFPVKYDLSHSEIILEETYLINSDLSTIKISNESCQSLSSFKTMNLENFKETFKSLVGVEFTSFNFLNDTIVEITQTDGFGMELKTTDNYILNDDNSVKFSFGDEALFMLNPNEFRWHMPVSSIFGPTSSDVRANLHSCTCLTIEDILANSKSENNLNPLDTTSVYLIDMVYLK